MGRPKRPFPVGKFMLEYKGKHNEEASYSISLQYTWEQNVFRKTTGLKCCPKDWNQEENRKRGALRASYGSDWRRDNKYLDDLVCKYDAIIKDYNEKYPGKLTKSIIKAILNDQPIVRDDGGRDFISFAIERLDSEYSRKKIGHSRYSNGLSSLRMFREFLVSTNNGTYCKDSIYLSEISTDIIDQLIRWRRNVKHNGDKTINHALAPILKAAESAAIQGLIPQKQNAAIQDMRIVIKPDLDDDGEKEFDNKYLTQEQLGALVEEYDNTKEVRRKEYLEMFLFAFHACGLRVIDIITLQWSHVNFEKREINKVQVKTRNRCVIPLTEPAIAILDKWKSKNLKSRYVFGLLADEFKLSDEENLYKRRNCITQSINQSLIPIGEKIGLPFPLTMKVARHTFAVLCLNNGMNMSIVGRLLGHSSTDITEKVYAQFLPATLEEEVKRMDFNYMPRTL